MRKSGKAVPFLVALYLSALGAAPAAADPIQLVSGGIIYSWQNAARISAGTPDGTHLDSEFGNFLTEMWNPDHACRSCQWTLSTTTAIRSPPRRH